MHVFSIPFLWMFQRAMLPRQSNTACKGEGGWGSGEIVWGFVLFFYESWVLESLQYGISSFCITQHNHDGLCWCNGLYIVCADGVVSFSLPLWDRQIKVRNEEKQRSQETLMLCLVLQDRKPHGLNTLFIA